MSTELVTAATVETEAEVFESVPGREMTLIWGAGYAEDVLTC